MDGTAALVEALLDATRGLVAVAARSLGDLEQELSLRQFRALVVLRDAGPLSTTALAGAVGVHQSSATRMTTAMLRSGLVSRRQGEDDRRTVVVELTEAGRRLVEQVWESRRALLRAAVARMALPDVEAAVVALEAFDAALSELPGLAADGQV